jgi:tetratricopeptide (TPR) repeat protein
MDWLDRLSIWAIVILIISSCAVIVGHVGEARPDRSMRQSADAGDHAAASGERDGMLKLAKNLMEGGNLDKAELLGRELLQKYPYDGGSHMAMGDILMRKQEPVKAAFEYKEAIDINPDFLDRKTPLFQGKKIKTAVTEAFAEIDRKLQRAPDDESLKKERKTIYYLQRRIAGSCG